MSSCALAASRSAAGARSCCVSSKTTVSRRGARSRADVIGHPPRRDLNHQPRGSRHAGLRPLLRRGEERLLDGVLGRREVAEPRTTAPSTCGTASQQLLVDVLKDPGRGSAHTWRSSSACSSARALACAAEAGRPARSALRVGPSMIQSRQEFFDSGKGPSSPPARRSSRGAAILLVGRASPSAATTRRSRRAPWRSES